jgi:hypothetical protein
LKRPIGIIQRRGKELGKTASRFMHLLLKQPSTSRQIAGLEDLELESSSTLARAAPDAAAADSPVTDDQDAPAAAADKSSSGAAARVAS